jgi:hypothetical protein
MHMSHPFQPWSQSAIRPSNFIISSIFFISIIFLLYRGFG